MQKRHEDRELYFNELAASSKEYFIPYIKQFLNLKGKRILEIGCGEGGNLYPMYKEGNDVKGIDLNTIKIEIANEIFGRETFYSNSYEFLDINFFEMKDFSNYDLIFVHDVIEHIIDKELFF